MGVRICNCFDSLCPDVACSPRGFALIKMIVPEECKELAIRNKVTGKSYGHNDVVVAYIDDSGCWESCELPFNDELTPEVTYQVVEFVYGTPLDCNADCVNCLGPDLCEESAIITNIYLDSNASYANQTECVQLAALDSTTPGFLPCANPNITSFELRHNTADTIQPVWFVPSSGNLILDYATIGFGAAVLTDDLFFSIIEANTNITKATFFLPAGSSSVSLAATEFVAEAGQSYIVQPINPLPSALPESIVVQARLLSC